MTMEQAQNSKGSVINGQPYSSGADVGLLAIPLRKCSHVNPTGCTPVYARANILPLATNYYDCSLSSTCIKIVCFPTIYAIEVHSKSSRSSHSRSLLFNIPYWFGF